jgi:bacterial/archaeal transporter family protein
MEKWTAYALLSMVFAGFTSVIAKIGLAGISGEMGIAIRTCFVFAFVTALALLRIPATELGTVTRQNVQWLAISAATTSLSWIFYYKALEQGEVSRIALIDKGSFVVALVLAWLLLKEPITLRVALGAALIVAGLVIVARK